MEDDAQDHTPDGAERNHDRDTSGHRPGGRETGAAPLYRAGEQVLVDSDDQPIGSLTVFIYDYSKAPFED